MKMAAYKMAAYKFFVHHQQGQDISMHGSDVVSVILLTSEPYPKLLKHPCSEVLPAAYRDCVGNQIF